VCPGGNRHETAEVVYDPDAVIDLEDVKGKEDRKALFNAVDKLCRIGPHLAPPHVKLLKGEVDLYELRPRQGNSPVRALYQRFDGRFVILAIAKKSDFDKKVRIAAERAKRYLTQR